MESSLPGWVQDAGIIAIALVSAIIGVFRYLKTEVKEEKTTVSTVNVIDPKLLKELIEAIKEFQDENGKDTKRAHRSLLDLKEAINNLAEVVVVQTDTSLNLLRFLNRENRRNNESERITG